MLRTRSEREREREEGAREIEIPQHTPYFEKDTLLNQ